jgi:hypothetical protein
MPPRKIAAPTVPPQLISIGSGMTAGLEIWSVAGKFVLYDRSTDGRFAADVASWNTAAGLNKATTEVFKNAACKNAT